MFKIGPTYDLTHPISAKVYHPFGSPSFEQYESFEREGAQTSKVKMSLHTGTHLDSPAHFVNGGKSLDQITVDHFIGEGLILDVSQEFGPTCKANQTILAKDLAEAEKATRQKLKTGYIVLVHTGWHHIFESEPERYYRDYSSLSDEAGKWLAEKKVKMVGIDACDVDPHQFYEKPPYKPPNHTTNFLPNNILICENVGGEIDSVIGKKVLLIVSPLRLVAEASPARIIALKFKRRVKL